jgi:hypothetical protein
LKEECKLKDEQVRVLQASMSESKKLEQDFQSKLGNDKEEKKLLF